MWQECIILVLSLVMLVTCDLASQRPPHLHENRLRDRDIVHDQQHIQEHLEGVAKMEENMSEEELQFHYFKLHDYNNDNMLDGIELTSAVTHFQKDDTSNQEPHLSEQEIEKMVDQILGEEDRNRDGYIDYAEFMLSQKNTADFN